MSGKEKDITDCFPILSEFRNSEISGADVMRLVWFYSLRWKAKGRVLEEDVKKALLMLKSLGVDLHILIKALEEFRNCVMECYGRKTESITEKIKNLFFRKKSRETDMREFYIEGINEIINALKKEV